MKKTIQSVFIRTRDRYTIIWQQLLPNREHVWSIVGNNYQFFLTTEDELNKIRDRFTSSEKIFLGKRGFVTKRGLSLWIKTGIKNSVSFQGFLRNNHLNSLDVEMLRPDGSKELDTIRSTEDFIRWAYQRKTQAKKGEILRFKFTNLPNKIQTGVLPPDACEKTLIIYNRKKGYLIDEAGWKFSRTPRHAKEFSREDAEQILSLMEDKRFSKAVNASTKNSPFDAIIKIGNEFLSYRDSNVVHTTKNIKEALRYSSMYRATYISKQINSAGTSVFAVPLQYNDDDDDDSSYL